MNITEATYNKIITSSLLAFCMFMYAVSYIQCKPLNLSAFLIMVAPIVSQTIHVVSNKIGEKTQ